MDISQRAEASETDGERYRLLINAITDYAIYMLDTEGYVSSWNPGARRFKGYEASEIVGRHFSRFYTEQDQADGLPARALQTAAREGKFEKEGWRVRKDGTQFWAHVVIDPIRDASGKLIGFAKITRDLTERQKAEETLRKSEEQFRLLVQGVTDYAIYMLDPDGHVSSWNPGAERIKGYTSDEIIQSHFSRFYSAEDQANGEPAKALDTARSEGRFLKEGWRIRKDGSRFWASVVIDALRDDAGALIGFAKITRDITERLERQRELDEAREALFQSQKMDAIGQLTGGIAHDFNNLLTAVLGSLELLRRRLPIGDERAERLLDNAISGAERGATLTQRMLAFARRQELKSEVVDLPALVAGMSDLLQRSLGATYILQEDFPEGIPPILADSNQVEMALLNLVVNARDALPDGGTITITAEDRPDAQPAGLPRGHFVVLSVTDNGTGMDAETLTHATEPFFTTKGVGKGTGLGLAMVYGLAEQSGGRLMLKSEPGKGTTAEIWLPAASDAWAIHNTETSKTARAEPITALKIIAVDDDSLVLMNTAALLEDLGHTVFEADRADQALAILESEPDIDLVITDQSMPDITGLQLIEIMRARWPDKKVILATGYGELPTGQNSTISRLGKPFGASDLANAISAVFK